MRTHKLTAALRVTHRPKTKRNHSSAAAAVSALTGRTAEEAAASINELRDQPVSSKVGNADPAEVLAVLRALRHSAVEMKVYRRPFLHLWALAMPQDRPILVRSGTHYRVLFNGRVTCSLHPDGLELGTWINDLVDEAWMVWPMARTASRVA